MTDVALRFGATDQGLEAQFRKVGRELETVDRATEKVGRTASSSFKAFAGAIAAVGFTRLVGEITQYADSLDKAAAQTGVTIEAIQRLGFVGNQVGVGAETITRAINKLQISLVSADEGSKEAAKGLSALGLSASSLINLAPDVAFDRIASAVAAIENPTERTAAAVAVFGKAGAELVPILSQSSAGLAAAREQFEALGGPVSTATVQGVDNMGDAFDGLKLSLKNLGTEIVGVVAGPFEELFQAAGRGIGNIRTALFGPELEAIKNSLEFLQDERDSNIPFILEAFKSAAYNPEGNIGVLGPEGIDARIKLLKARQRELEAGIALQGGDLQTVIPTARRFEVPAAGSGAGGPAAARGGPASFDPEALGDIGLPASKLEKLSIMQEQFREKNLKELQTYSDELMRISLAAEEQRVADTIDAEQRIFDLKAGAIDAAGNLLSLLATKSKTAAIALIAVNKATAIAQIIQNTAAAAAKAIAIYGPTPAGFAAAASAKAFGALQIGLVAATGALEVGSISGGGGGGGGAGGGSLAVGGGSEQKPAAAAVGATPNSATTIYISGFISRDVINDLVTKLQNELNRDVVLFGANSRQAIELR